MEFRERLNIFHTSSLVDFLTISQITNTYTKIIPGLYRGPPQDKGWDEDEKTINEAKVKRKICEAGKKKRIKINI